MDKKIVSEIVIFDDPNVLILTVIGLLGLTIGLPMIVCLLCLIKLRKEAFQKTNLEREIQRMTQSLLENTRYDWLNLDLFEKRIKKSIDEELRLLLYDMQFRSKYQSFQELFRLKALCTTPRFQTLECTTCHVLFTTCDLIFTTNCRKRHYFHLKCFTYPTIFALPCSIPECQGRDYSSCYLWFIPIYT